VSKDDSPCKMHGPSTEKNGPYQCGSIGHECASIVPSEPFAPVPIVYLVSASI